MSLIFSLTGCIKVYDTVVALTKGGPGTSTYMPSMLMYDQAFTYGNFGYGSVIALMILVECTVLTAIINKIFCAKGSEKMKKNKTVKVVSLLVIGIALIISLYPVVWLVLSSFKSTQEFSLYPDIFHCQRVSIIENYIEAWTSGNMGVYFRNSIYVH